MSDYIVIKRGSSVQRRAFVPRDGELVWDKTAQELYVGNNMTSGGVPVSSSMVNLGLLRSISGSIVGFDFSFSGETRGTGNLDLYSHRYDDIDVTKGNYTFAGGDAPDVFGGVSNDASYSLSWGQTNEQHGVYNVMLGAQGAQGGQYNFSVGLANIQNTTYSAGIDSNIQIGRSNTQNASLGAQFGRSLNQGAQSLYCLQFGVSGIQYGEGHFQGGINNSTFNSISPFLSTGVFQFGQSNVSRGNYNCQIGNFLNDGGRSGQFIFGNAKSGDANSRAYFSITKGVWLKNLTSAPLALENGVMWVETGAWKIYLNGAIKTISVT